MTGNWNIILVISLGAAIASVLAMMLKSRLHGESDSNPPILRHVAAYFLAYVLGFMAVAVFFALWGLHQALLLIGIDLLAKDFVARS